MPKYDTPNPISVQLELSVGNVLIDASDRADTLVEVRPTDESDDADVQTARKVRVDYTDGTLRVIGPKAPLFDFSRKPKSVDVSIELPSGSAVRIEAQVSDVRSTGVLGDVEVKTSVGNVRVDHTGALRLSTTGHVTADHVAGDAEVSTGNGKIQIGEIAGTVMVKSSNGDTAIDTVSGDVRVRSANGDIRVGSAGADVDAKTSMGDIRLDVVASGTVVLATSMGDLDVGIADGTAALLNVDTGFGLVRNQLDNVQRPEAADKTVELRGRTSYGDVTIRRS